MKMPLKSGCNRRTQSGIVGSASGGLDIRKLIQRGSIASPSAKAARSASSAGARRRPAMMGASSRSTMAWPRSSCDRRLAGSRLGCAGAAKADRTCSSK